MTLKVHTNAERASCVAES